MAAVDDVRIAVAKFKNNKSPGQEGIAAELIKFEGDELIIALHKLICITWNIYHMAYL